MQGFIKTTNSLEQKRNTLIHSEYVFLSNFSSKHFDNESDSQLLRRKVTAKQKRGLKVDSEIIEPHELKSFIEEVQSISDYFSHLAFTYFDHVIAPQT